MADMAGINFEIKSKDIAARIGKLEINGKEVITPTLMPVYSPNNPVITVAELKKEFGVDVLMTNAYIILKNEKLRDGILRDGIHKYLDFDGIIATCAPTHVPKALINQLKEGGRLVIPVGEKYTQTLVLYVKKKGKLVEKDNVPVRFVPMINDEGKTY